MSSEDPQLDVDELDRVGREQSPDTLGALLLHYQPQIEQLVQRRVGAASSEAYLRKERADAQRLIDVMAGWIRRVPRELKPLFGKTVNELKTMLAAAFDARLAELANAGREAELSGPEVDTTLPGVRPRVGRLHPLRIMAEDATEAFAKLGFDVIDGPEVERYDYNFTKLNFPPDHPATDMQDSFFLQSSSPESRVLLRTHTSNMQIRAMLGREPPMAIATTGACFRRDEEDATHVTMFQQIEVFVVGEGISFAHLRGTLDLWLRRTFGEATELRFRPSFFPFVEPGAEVDIRVPDPRGGSARWRELGGCGMIHPNVLSACGHDPERWTGFAWGFGLDRMAMSRFAIPDIRMLYENDVRFLQQF